MIRSEIEHEIDALRYSLSISSYVYTFDESDWVDH
jgi:hypothetical protein